MFDSINMAEGQFLLYVQEHLRFRWLTPWMKIITSFGDVGIFWIVLTLMILFVSAKKMRGYPIYGQEDEVRMYRFWNHAFQTGIMCVAALVLMFLLNDLILKNFFARIRPYDLLPQLEVLVSKEVDYSFPSGHTAVSFACAFVIYRRFPRKLGIPCMVLACLIGISRLYVGVHYPTDVIGGIIIGLLCGLAALEGVGNVIKREGL